MNYILDVFLAAYVLYYVCLDLSNTSCLEQVLTEGISLDLQKFVNKTRGIINYFDFTQSFEPIVSTLWHAKLPCFDTVDTM